jgi:tetratricopeptide (TPR) repeat protein
MPRSGTSDVAHDVVTDHSIPGRRRVRTGPTALVAFRGVADNRSLGLAYAEAGDSRAVEHLKLATPADAPVLLRLGRYEEVLRTDPTNITALVNLGVARASSGNIAEAAALWERALKVNPAIEGAALNLAKVRPPADAKAILQRYLGFDPGSAAVRAALESLK